MPELPEARRKRMIAEYELTEQDAQTLTATREFADRFESGGAHGEESAARGESAAERTWRAAEGCGD